jgi:hypothetical protein
MAANVKTAPGLSFNFDNTYSRLPEYFYRRVAPTPLRGAFLAAVNQDAARLLDLTPEQTRTPEFLEFFSGAKILEGAEPLAAVYAGHQFGVYVPQLGDGRAILLGEAVNQRGERLDLQLKGAGPTPFSRMGDGRAVLRSCVREYLCSEAMHGLGIPTTRALCVIGSEEPVRRETIEKGAAMVRLAPSHVRFGSFEFFHYHNLPQVAQQLADYILQLHYAELLASAQPYAALFQEVVTRTAQLMAQWQAVGFAHGVMNTDNMSILGLTIDYGPFGFVDEYDAGYICNHSDHTGRYAFGAQPQVAFWNLACLAQALSALVPQDDLIDGLNSYQSTFAAAYHQLMRGKLGLTDAHPDAVELTIKLLETLQANRVDYTRFFRALARFDEAKNDELRDMFINPLDFDEWAVGYRELLRAAPSGAAQRRAQMLASNPKYILRNYLAQNAIARAEAGDYTEIERLMDLLRRPFDEQPEREEYAALPPEWSKRLEISCSS